MSILMLPSLHNVKASILGVALANKKPDSTSYEAYKQKLSDQLKSSGGNLVGDPIAFYKESDIKKQAPAGYVIETDNCIMICYHGTQFRNLFGSGGKEIQHDLEMHRANMRFGDADYGVHAGFKKEYEASKASLYVALASIIPSKSDKSVSISGHSLGGAVAQIAALDATTNKVNPPITISEVITFGGPRVFSPAAAKKYNDMDLGDKSLRIKQGWDIVPRIPPKGMFEHVGWKITLDAGSMAVHSGSVYRRMMTRLTHTHIDEAKESRSMSEAPVESYLDAIKKLSQEVYKALTRAVVSASKLLVAVSEASSADITPHNIVQHSSERKI